MLRTTKVHIYPTQEQAE
ncbi:helix-turn-helix domain-containing protein [Escherichia coli]|nr:helix-turn-helix domain-containing protein [Escherichia coli]EGF1779223.1 helix-turn-helix domain-containing protein [Escherichia coli]